MAVLQDRHPLERVEREVRRRVHLGFEVVKGVGDLVMGQDNARHLDIDATWKAVQRNLGHRCLHAAAKPKAWLGTRSATALGPTSGRVAVLGRNALGNRATALGPASKERRVGKECR